MNFTNLYDRKRIFTSIKGHRSSKKVIFFDELVTKLDIIEMLTFDQSTQIAKHIWRIVHLSRFLSRFKQT